MAKVVSPIVMVSFCSLNSYRARQIFNLISEFSQDCRTMPNTSPPSRQKQNKTKNGSHSFLKSSGSRFSKFSSTAFLGSANYSSSRMLRHIRDFYAQSAGKLKLNQNSTQIDNTKKDPKVAANTFCDSTGDVLFCLSRYHI